MAAYYGNRIGGGVVIWSGCDEYTVLNEGTKNYPPLLMSPVTSVLLALLSLCVLESETHR